MVSKSSERKFDGVDADRFAAGGDVGGASAGCSRGGGVDDDDDACAEDFKGGTVRFDLEAM